MLPVNVAGVTPNGTNVGKVCGEKVWVGNVCVRKECGLKVCVANVGKVCGGKVAKEAKGGKV